MNRFYRFFFPIVNFCYRLVFPLDISGWDTIPGGAALVCGNHSSYADPVIAILAFTQKHPLHFMAKASLFEKPFLRFVLKKVEAFPVHRDKGGATALKQAMKYLKNGEKVMLFPEGRRVKGDDAASAKQGAAMLSIRTGAPLIPVYLPEKRRAFRKNRVVIGAPYSPATEGRRGTTEEYQQVADDLLQRIYALGREAAS